jgi:hypothetical protein
VTWRKQRRQIVLNDPESAKPLPQNTRHPDLILSLLALSLFNYQNIHPHIPSQSIMSSIKPLVLHAHTTGPNPIKIAIALETLKLPYEVKLWEFGDDAENGLKGAKFFEINENGRVPALQDPNSGVVSWESGAIMNYIRRKYDTENKLGPPGQTEQDIVDFEKWEYFLLTTLGPMAGQCNWYRYSCYCSSMSSNCH